MTLTLQTPAHGAAVSLLREKHLDYIANPRNDPTSKVDWLALREVQDDLSTPEPLRFSYIPPIDGEILLTDGDGETRTVPAFDGEAWVQNLKIGTEYVWSVRVFDGDRNTVAVSEPRTFRTDPQVPRMLSVDGISNVRDFGGFETANGQKIRQGLLYRTSELDTHVSVTKEGRRILEADLGVRVDLDLRGIKDEPRGPTLDRRVRWVNFPLAAYAEIFTEEQVRRYGESYSLLTDPENFPMIVHCWGGIDRTGCWLYILGGMLGVSEDDLGLDYEMSSFSRWGRRSRRSEQFTAFREGLLAYGDGLQSACVGFMKAGGLTDADLDRIRANLLVQG